MASEGGGKIKNKRGYSSSKPYERKKSLFRRITDSIKDVLRPSWLAADADSVSEATATASSSAQHDEEEYQVNPSPPMTQLSSLAGLGMRSGEHSRQLHQAPSDSAADTSIPWQQNPQLSSLAGLGMRSGEHSRQLHQAPSDSVADSSIPWQQSPQRQQSYVRKSTWGNSPAVFDKDKFSSNFFTQHSTSIRHKQSMPEMSVGLGGPAPIDPSSTKSAPSLSSAGQRTLLFSHSALTAAAPSQQRDSGIESIRQSVSSQESATDHPEENPFKRQRLWSPEANRKGRALQPAVHNKPAFKMSVFCSPSLNESLHESPFYSGKTTYGGASASRRKMLGSSLPYQNSLPIRKSVKAKPLNNSGNAVLSASAAQILKTLERLSDAKRCQVSETETDSLLSFTPSSYRKPSRPLQTALPSRSLELPVRGPPVHQLQSPVPAVIAKNHQIVSFPARRTQPPAATVTRHKEDARECDQGSDDDIQIVDAPETGSISSHSGHSQAFMSRTSGKVKHAKSYEMRRQKRGLGEEEEIVEVPNLRTDFTLPIHNATGFSLGLTTSTVSSLPTPSSSAASIFSRPSIKAARQTTLPVESSRDKFLFCSQSPPKLEFQFSSPIHKSGPDSSESSSAPLQNFQFSSPLTLRGASSLPGSQQQAPPVSTSIVSPASACSFSAQAWGSTAPKPKFSSGNEGLVINVSDSRSPVQAVGFGTSTALKPASELKTGSVMDFLRGETSVKPAAQKKLDKDSEVQAVKSGSSSTGDSLFAKFAATPGSWECDSCLLQNKPEALKCVACESPKPGVTQKVVPAGSWECSACLLQNKAEADRCLACDTAKPGAVAAAAAASSSSLGDLKIKFQKPAGGWDCEVCLVQNTGAHSKCLACQSPRPGTQAMGSVPASGSVVKSGPDGGLVLNISQSPGSQASPFLLASSSKDPSSSGIKFGSVSGGFQIGTSSSMHKDTSVKFGTSSGSEGFKFGTSSVTGSEGFKFGTSSLTEGSSGTGNFKFGTSTVDSFQTGGFKFGPEDSCNSSSASSTLTITSFQLGSKKSTESTGTSVTKTAGFTFNSDTNSRTVLSTSVNSDIPCGAPSASSPDSVNRSLGFGAMISSTESAGITSSLSCASNAQTATGGISFAAQGSRSEVKSGDKLTSVVSTHKVAAFSPVFGTGKPSSNSFSLGAAPSLNTGSLNSISTGAFPFGSPVSSSIQVFGSSEVTLPDNKTFEAESGGTAGIAKNASGVGAFSFTSVTKPGLFTAATVDSSSKNGPFSHVPALSASQGIVFGVPGGSSSIFSNVSQPASQGSSIASVKATVNGEVGPGGLFAFSQQPASAVGLSFGRSTTGMKDSTHSSHQQGIGSTGPSNSTCEKRRLDNDVGPGDAKKRPGAASTASAEPFKFGGTDSAGGGSSLFKFGQTASGLTDKVSGSTVFGGQTTGFGGQTTAAQTGSVFGAGTGNTATGQFSFSLGTGCQSNAAAASPFGSNAPASSLPAQGFNFTGATQPSFNFGSSSTSMPSSVFQFGSATRPAADNTTTLSSALNFGAAATPSSLSGGAEGSRKFKKAVRRTKK